jgi:hypothetical protein
MMECKVESVPLLNRVNQSAENELDIESCVKLLDEEFSRQMKGVICVFLSK